MTVSVLVPWRAGCPWRERGRAWVHRWYATERPEWEYVEGHCAGGPFNRAEAIIDAFRRSTGELLVVADADVFGDGIGRALGKAREHGWSIPHRLLHRLSEASSDQVMAGRDWRGLPLSTDNKQDSRPYIGHETGTLVVLRRDVLLDVPPDVRFVGWGSEDDAWAAALRTLIGTPWRGSADLVHLWHPAQPRQSRTVGNEASRALCRRYLKARRDPAAMRALIDEVEPWRSTTSSSTTAALPRS